MTGLPPQPDRAASLEFLAWYEPGGPWCLTGIHPDPVGDPGDETRRTPTRTFVPGEERQVEAWLDAHAGWNVYFSVNAVRGRPTKKCSKADIAQMRWVHVDVDPADGVDVAVEQARIAELLTGDTPGGLPAPTLVTFSGGGYQAFWRLSPPMTVRDKAHAEGELEHHLAYVIKVLGGDKTCKNVDRIMRLPGTVNWPNERKRKKGRQPALAAVVLKRATAYDLAAFPRAEPEAPSVKAQHHAANGAAKGAPTPAPLTFYAGPESLPACVPDALRAVLVQGHDPADPKRLPSRSEWCWYAVCELVRVGLTDDEIAPLLVDPKFAISAHVLSQKDVPRYVLRQIARARERAVDPLLLELNDRHAVIADVGGRCRILGEVYDHAFDRTRVSTQSFQDFKNRYCNRKMKVGEKKGEPVFAPAGEWWVHHPRRRQFETMTFAPGKDVPTSYNLWRGFSCEPKLGDCSMYLRHVLEVACSSNDEHYQYLLDWMARAVQRPGEVGQVAVVLKGRMGAGKGVVARHLGSLFGRHFLQVSNSAHLVGQFNAHLRDCVLLFADEAFYAGDKKHESILKTLVTEETLVIEQKGVDVEVYPNFVHLLVASNEEWSVPAGLGDRRFLVLQVAEDHVRDVSYFRAMDEQMRAGGKEALLHFLLTRDISNFEVRSRPETAELQVEKAHGMTREQSWWAHKLAEGRVFQQAPGWQEVVVCQELADDFVAASRKWGQGAKGSPVKLGIFLRKVVPNLERRRLTTDHQYRDQSGLPINLSRPNAYLFPDLEACREHWRTRFDAGAAWEDPPDYVRTPFSDAYPQQATERETSR